MCTVCGCGQATVDKTMSDGDHRHTDGHGETHHHDHHHDDHDGHHRGHHHGHDHGDHHHHHHEGGSEQHLDYGSGPARVHVPGMSDARVVQVERDILSENDRLAAGNRAVLERRGILALNLVSSPGSGKTTLLVRTIEALRHRLAVSVIEGDQQTSFDAERIRATGAPTIQINTGKGCHLDARMVGDAIGRLDPEAGSVLFIENVGNLVCPAAFDLGEAHKVVMISVTEGEDKPLKYPDMFHAADLMLLTKIDLLPHLRFDVERCLDFASRVNPAIEMMQLSAVSGEGLKAWYGWIDRCRGGRPEVDARRSEATA